MFLQKSSVVLGCCDLCDYYYYYYYRSTFILRPQNNNHHFAGLGRGGFLIIRGAEMCFQVFSIVAKECP